MPPRTGSPNKNKKFLLNKLQEMYGDDFHPIMKMAGNAKLLQDKVDSMMDSEGTIDVERDGLLFAEPKEKPEYENVVKAIQAANAEWSRVAEYTEPKLKAVEHSLSDDMDGISFSMSYGSGVSVDELKHEIDELKSQVDNLTDSGSGDVSP